MQSPAGLCPMAIVWHYRKALVMYSRKSSTPVLTQRSIVLDTYTQNALYEYTPIYFT